MSAQFLITGGSAGIGLEIARKLVAEGASVHISARGSERLKQAASDLDGAVFIYECDLAKADERERLIKQVAENSGGVLDGLVLNAAKYGYVNLLDMELAEVEDYFEINTISSWHLVKLAHEMLTAGSGKSILMISSTLGNRPVPGTGAYAASKAAMNMLTRAFSVELASEGIRVNAILPGVVDTGIHEPQGPDDPSREEKLAMLGPMHPMGRVGKPEEVAEAAMFLLSDKSAWTTGSLFFVDGGISIV